MPLQIPVLDDRRFADLLVEARSLIPTYAPEWTNHNPTDPGITIVELLAHLAEMLIYRLDRVTTANVVAFLNLLDGRTRAAADFEGKDLQLAAEIRATILHVRELDRAVTSSDFEMLAARADPLGRIERTRAVPRRNLGVDLIRDKPGHVSVIILTRADDAPALPDLIDKVQAYLEPRVLLTTRAHVLGPFFLDVTVQTAVVPLPDQLEADVKRSVASAVAAFLDPHTGGDDGSGWPFGRDVFASDLYALIDRLPEVDYVLPTLSLVPAPPDRVIQRDGKLIGAALEPYELVRAHIGPDQVTVLPL